MYAKAKAITNSIIVKIENNRNVFSDTFFSEKKIIENSNIYIIKK